MSNQHARGFGWAAVFAVAALTAGCGDTTGFGGTIDVTPGGDDAAVDVPGVDNAADAGADAGTDTRPTPDSAPGIETGVDAGLDAGVDAAPIVCRSDSDCASGQTCCTSTGRCYDARCLACCMPRVDAGPSSCASNANCTTAEYCAGSGCSTSGTCVPRPMGCTLEYNPVCGCDGHTYGNACAAAATGVRVISTGACGSVDGGTIDGGTTGCATARECAAGQECVYPDAACVTRGVCMAAIACLRPETFCSCAGVTYMGCRPDRPTGVRGPCAVLDAGVDAIVDTGTDRGTDTGTGICSTDRDCASGQSCCGLTGHCYNPACLACCMFAPPDGGLDVVPVDVVSSGCVTARDCRAGQECVYPATGCAATGTCTAAIACLIAQPFCSCTGVSYSACRPDRSTRSTGSCSVVDAGTDTGTSFCSMVRCAAGTVCCEAARACIPMGALCIAPTDAGTDTGPSVCRSDRDCATGMTCCTSTGACYDSRCLACCMPRFDAGPGGCLSNADCTSTQYCSGTGCSTAGTCATRPTFCSTLYSPVCGCNGRTYSNECNAQAAGERVASRGLCP